jgi:outer membrane receptor protein involved in Fe transport
LLLPFFLVRFYVSIPTSQTFYESSLLFKPNTQQTIYFSASRGFSLPATEETLTSEGTINTNIKPENGYNFEVGGKFYFFNRKLYTEIAVYRMEIKDFALYRPYRSGGALHVPVAHQS